MNRVLKKFFLILSLVFIVNTASAQSQKKSAANAGTLQTDEQKDFSEFYSKQIESINFSGMKKTQNSYIQSKIHKYIDVPLSEKVLHELETTLKIENLFDEMNFSMSPASESKVSINIDVKEKITFIPLPFIAFSSGNAYGGLMIMDTNAFGIKDMFAFGGIISKDSQSAMAFYTKAPKDNHIPGFGISFSAGNNLKKFKNLDAKENDDYILLYKSLDISAGISISEKLTENSSISAKFDFSSINTKKYKNYDKSVDSIKIGAFSLDWRYSKSDWNGWFLSNTGLYAGARFALTNDSKHQGGQIYTAGFAFQKPFLPRLRLISQSSASIGKNNHIANYSGRSAASVTIVSDKFASQRLAGSSNGFEFALTQTKFGIISAYANYEVLYAQDFDGEYEFCHGPSFGSKLYLSKIAFPALSIALSYNVTKKYWQYAVAMGVNI